jgi:hypothetical protein
MMIAFASFPCLPVHADERSFRTLTENLRCERFNECPIVTEAFYNVLTYYSEHIGATFLHIVVHGTLEAVLIVDAGTCNPMTQEDAELSNFKELHGYRAIVFRFGNMANTSIR